MIQISNPNEDYRLTDIFLKAKKKKMSNILTDVAKQTEIDGITQTLEWFINNQIRQVTDQYATYVTLSLHITHICYLIGKRRLL